MSLETQRKNIVHRILDVENEQLLDQNETLLNNDVYSYTTSGKPLSSSTYKNHLEEIIKVSEEEKIGYTTDEAKKKIIRK